MKKQKRPVVLFAWGYTTEDATQPVAHAQQHAEWQRWRIVRTLGPVVGGAAQNASREEYASEAPLATDKWYGRVCEFYDPLSQEKIS